MAKATDPASTHTEGTFTNSDGMTLYHQQWLPQGKPKAAVMLWHGFGEHSGRYHHVADALTKAGYAVYALDHRGHGRSEGKRVYVRSYDEYLRDLVAERSWVKQQQPDLPLFVLGHSMGGNLALRHTLDHQDGLAGVVLTGPLIKPADEIPAAKAAVVSLLGKVAPGLRPEAIDATAISRDPAVVEAYLADPLVYNGKITVGLAAALIGSMKAFPDRFGELEIPVLLMHGTEDRLTSIDGSRMLEAGAVNAPVTAHYYEGLYHEVFNEPEQDQVIADMIEWLDTVTSSVSARSTNSPQQ